MHERNDYYLCTWFSCIQVNAHFLTSETLRFQLTSVLAVTCYVAILWPELWLQWKSDHCERGCSGVSSDINTLELDPIYRAKLTVGIKNSNLTMLKQTKT